MGLNQFTKIASGCIAQLDNCMLNLYRKVKDFCLKKG
jgi:hypothetical protein